MGSLFGWSVATRTAFVGLLVAAGMFSVGVRDARADILVSLPSVAEGTNPGEWLWEYVVDVDDDQRVETLDFFTIYDFLGFIPGSNAQPANWTFTSANLGTTPLSQNPADDPSIPNLTWTYTGLTPIATPGSTNVLLGIFSAESSFNLIDPDTDLPFAVLDSYSTLGTVDGSGPITKKATTSVTEVPGDPVPEPGSMILLGSGLLGAAAMIRRRKNAALETAAQ